MAKRIVEVGKLELRDETWHFVSPDTTMEYNLRKSTTLFEAIIMLSRDGWEPAFGHDDKFFFKRIW
jgi:hypothetical protein